MGRYVAYATKDAFISNGVNADSNFGDWAELRIGRSENPAANPVYSRTLLYFNLAPIMGKEIIDANLRMWLWYDYNGNPMTFSVHTVNASWAENTVTWNNQPAYSESNAITITESGQPGRWTDYWITNLVKAIAAGQLYHGFLLRQPGSTINTEKSYTSLQFGEDPINGTPYLIINYKSGFIPRAGGSWRENAETLVRVGGSWRAGQVFARAGGSWREI